MILVSTPFTFETERGEGRHFFTMLNMSPLKTLFNMGNPIVSVLIAGWVFHLLGGVAGDISLPGVLLPAAVFVALVILLNSSILFALLSLNGQASFLMALRSDVVQLLANLLLCGSYRLFYGLPYEDAFGHLPCHPLYAAADVGPLCF